MLGDVGTFRETVPVLKRLVEIDQADKAGGREEVTCPRSHSRSVADLTTEPQFPVQPFVHYTQHNMEVLCSIITKDREEENYLQSRGVREGPGTCLILYQDFWNLSGVQPGS